MFRCAEVLAPNRREGRSAASRQELEEALAGDRLPEGSGKSIESLAVHHCNLCAAMRHAKLVDAIPIGFDMIHVRVQDYVTLAITGKAQIAPIQLRRADPIQKE
jgi:hypothetical protein